jgi:hypothetical protein
MLGVTEWRDSVGGGMELSLGEKVLTKYIDTFVYTL